jgi:tetratricopeptide (TPR) repeat protein
MKRQVLLAIAMMTIAASVSASWYDEYDAGIAAVKKGQWQVVIQKMSAAIAGNPKENSNARTYGNIFYNYHPYYYRGLAYLRTGQYDKAISDFEKTEGPGEVDRGSIDELMHDAKTRQASATTPEPQPPTPPTPVPQQPMPQPVPHPVPAGPVIDQALRQQVTNAINAANQSLASARDRKAAGTNEYRNALNALADANQRLATAKSNDDLQAALGPANNAKLFADSAIAPAPNIPQPLPPTTTIVSKPTGATNIVLGDTAKRVRNALEHYFSGDFDEASSQFERLAQEMPKNGWIWAFLGASQYSRYAFEADESYRAAALQSFRKAKQLRTWKGGLPQKYFSKRIRAAFAQG